MTAFFKELAHFGKKDKNLFFVSADHGAWALADFKKELTSGGNIDAAVKLGARLADKAREAGVIEVAFDRSGYKYHGRVKAMADAAREGGLKF